MKYYLMIGVLLTAAALMATVVAYPHLPSSVATHWDMDGQPNGYSPKWAVFLTGPGLMAGMILLMYFLPWLSPRKFELDNFRSAYCRIMLIVICMLAYFHALVLWVGIGHPLRMGRATIGGACVLVALLGNLMGKVRRNFFIGIKTPWTLASERVWNATHRFAAKAFVIGGVVGLAFTAFGLAGWLAIVALATGAFLPVLYSLVFYKQLQRRGEL
jgi:uncharacterized membrane protein